MNVTGDVISDTVKKEAEEAEKGEEEKEEVMLALWCPTGSFQSFVHPLLASSLHCAPALIREHCGVITKT